MKIKELNNIGTVSINTDLSRWELPPESITFGINFKPTSNFLESTTSESIISIPATDIKAGHAVSVEVSSGIFIIVAGQTAVNVYDGAVFSDISSIIGYPGLGAGDEFFWTSCLLGSIPIINNKQHYPEYWSPQQPAQVLQPLQFSPTQTWSEAGKSFKTIRSFNNFLFALNLVEGGVELPNSYRWSHPADTNGLPFTWDESDLSSIASIEQILGDSGAIVDGLTLRNSFCIYSERGVTILDRSNDEFIFNARKLSSTYGLLNVNSLVEVKGIHYFLGDGDIFMNDGNTIKSIAYNKIRIRMNSQINVPFYYRSYAVVHKNDKEIWFIIPEGTSETPNTAYIYSWYSDTWGIKSISQNIAHSCYAPLSEPPKTWATVTGTNDSTTLNWGSQSSNPLNKTLLGVSNLDSSIISINPLQADGLVDLNSRIERTDLYFEGASMATTMTRMYPMFETPNPVSIQVGSQQYPGGPVTWKQPNIFNPSSDRKLDVRTTGKLHAWRVDSIGALPFSLSKISFEYALAGNR